MLYNKQSEDIDNMSEEDKKFVKTRNELPKYELGFGEYGALFGLFILIFVAFRETFKVIRKS